MTCRKTLLICTLLCALAGSAHAQDFVKSYQFPIAGTGGPIGESFANSGITTFFLSWQPVITVTACTVQVDSSSDGSSWGNGDVIAAQTCTSSGSASGSFSKNFVRIKVTTLSGGGLNVTLKGSLGGSGGGTSQAYVTISTNCTSAIAPCVQAPASGGCFGGAVTTSGSSVVTFTSGFPAGVQVGMEAWVQTENLAANPCPSSGWVQNYTQSNTCGTPSTVSPPITVTAVNPGVSVTLSSNSNCPTQNGTNSWIYYGFNLRSAFQAACNTSVNSGAPYIRVGAGFWVLDNVGQSPAGAAICGSNAAGQAAPAPAGIEGDSFNTTYFVAPPWYNHTGDTATFFALGTGGTSFIKNFTLDLTYTNLALPHGTPFGGVCWHADSVRLTGINFGPSSNAEILYNRVGCTNSNGTAGVVQNSFIATGQRVFALAAPTSYFASINNNVYCNSNCFLENQNGALNSVVQIHGGFYQGSGSTQGGISDGSIIGRQIGTTASGDIFEIANAQFCMSGAVPAINDPESAGELRISNSLINANCTGYGGIFGANAGGVSIASGVTAYITNTKISAAGTGNTINNAGVMYLDASTVQNLSGGAGVVNTGTIHHPESGTCVFAASTTCTITFAVPFGANPNLVITPVSPGAVTFTVTALSGTGATLTGSSSNSVTVNWSAQL